MALHISVSAEPVFHAGPIIISNSILASWVVTGLIIAVSLWAYKNVKDTKRPSGLQNILEMMVDGLYNMTAGITESEARTNMFFPYFIGFFLFILLNNWFGLLPGVGSIGYRESDTKPSAAVIRSTPFVKQVQAASENVPENTSEPLFVPYLRAATADLNTTLALAIISVVATQIVGIKFLGLSYFKKFINFKGPIDAFVGILEAISEISHIISFAFRLFGNIFAGEVLLAVMSLLVPVLVPSAFIGLEIFVGAIQAFVFAMLTLVFMQMASQGHQEEAHA